MNILKTLLVAISTLVICLLLANTASAETQNAVQKLCSAGVRVDNWLRNLAYLMAPIGLTLIAIQAFFGKFKSLNFISLGGGLFIVSTSHLLIMYLTDGGAGSGACS